MASLGKKTLLRCCDHLMSVAARSQKSWWQLLGGLSASVLRVKRYVSYGGVPLYWVTLNRGGGVF